MTAKNSIQHKWAAGGVSSYPLSHPIVGQRQFFETFRHFIHLVDKEAEEFAHVFAVIAQWGVGKSRLGYELVAQVNESSQGWHVREQDGSLKNAELFNNNDDREQYLALYIRYSQIANDYHNVDNWFAFGLYKSLVFIAKEQFDNSIQGQIAKEAYDRLLVDGFDHEELAARLEIGKKHSDEELYTDPTLATRLCQAAYEYLSTFGIKYVLVVLDELETAAEAATYGLESDDLKKLDGRAIKLMGKAIKEEDPRRKLPWLRYVALCSPSIGDELREIQSTARRFEMVELSANSFSDVSTFVKILSQDGKLPQYPTGLVEAAYTMSAGNFGWFNVIMANVDNLLEQRRIRGEATPKTLGELFAELVGVSTRIKEYVLDHNAIEVLNLGDRSKLQSARELLYGQLPVALDTFTLEERQVLLASRNEYDEPLALLFRRVEWDDMESVQALRESKFNRDKSYWRLGGIDQPLDLNQLLSNLGTYAIHETQGESHSKGKRTLVVPLLQSDFVQLVGLLYPHPAAEDAARALWRKFLGNQDIPGDEATHIGPSLPMIARLDLRHRQQGQRTLVFRDPDMGEAHNKAMEARKGESQETHARNVLTGAMRVLDQNWEYDVVAPGFGDEVVAITTAAKTRQSTHGGLVTLDGLKLHPKGRVVMAWARNLTELEKICHLTSSQFSSEGRYPVMVFTSSRALIDQFESATTDTLKNAASYMMVYQVSSSEENALNQVGLPRQDWHGFELNDTVFTTAFSNRLQSIVRPFMQAVAQWRAALDDMGRIAWPFRASGNLRENELDVLIKGWCWLMVAGPAQRSLLDIDEKAPISVEDLTAVLGKLRITPKARAAGYSEDERARLFTDFDQNAKPTFPPFLVGLLKRLLRDQPWTMDAAKREWFWAYTQDGAKDRTTYQEWMSLLCEMGFAKEAQTQGRGPSEYKLVTRSHLSNQHIEANNWLTDAYGKTVRELEAVFGQGRVQELFGPEGSAYVGTKTKDARARLKKAKEALNQLNIAEPAVAFDDREKAADELQRCSHLRKTAAKESAFVYDKDRYAALQMDDNIKTLNFEDDQQELWRRIRRAELFMQYIRRAEKLMRARVDALQHTISEKAPDAFPIRLFTLSLAKVNHILDGALNLTQGSGQTEALQASEQGTLQYYLRSLHVADASSAVDKLAGEIGLDIRTGSSVTIDEIDGSIFATYRTLHSLYDDLLRKLEDHQGRLKKIATALEDAPKDFNYPSDVPSLKSLLPRPELIREELDESRTEEVDKLLEEFSGPARLGNFKPLMDRASRIFDSPRKSSQDLAGFILTLENAITGYRQQLLSRKELQGSLTAYNALLRAKSKTPITAPSLATLEAHTSLKQSLDHLASQTLQWMKDGNYHLQSTGVSFDRWRTVVEALMEGNDPDLDPGEAEKLVSNGFIRRTYSLSGGMS